MFDIQEELKKLPGKPGVYLMHDEIEKETITGKEFMKIFHEVEGIAEE